MYCAEEKFYPKNLSWMHNLPQIHIVKRIWAGVLAHSFDCYCFPFILFICHFRDIWSPILPELQNISERTIECFVIVAESQKRNICTVLSSLYEVWCDCAKINGDFKKKIKQSKLKMLFFFSHYLCNELMAYFSIQVRFFF